MPALSELRLVVETSLPNYPTVRILVDGEERLEPDGGGVGNDPADLLDTGALLPHAVPRRIALYGCGCGEFGCFCVAPLISEHDGVVRWSDFRTITGEYGAALSHNGTPDPAADPEVYSRRLELDDVWFDAAAYRAEVARAAADRGWESRARAVVRRLRELDPTWPGWAAREGDAVTVHYRVDGMADSADVAIPAGPVDRVAAALLDLVARHDDPREIEARGLWAAAVG